MKEFVKIPIVFLAFFVLLPFSNVKAEERLEEYKAGSLFNVPELRLKENTFVMDCKYDDITGDNIKDNIILVGRKNYEAKGIERDEIKIIIQNGKTKRYYKLSPGKYTVGNNGVIFLGDFNGDKILDILVSFCGKGAYNYPYYSLITFKDNKAKYLLEQENFASGLSFDIDFVDNYKVSVFNRELNKFYNMDVSTKKYTYDRLGLYDELGELLKKQEGFSGAISELRPVDVDKDGVYELVGVQCLSGICPEDVIGYAKSLWRYKDRSMKLLSVEIIPFAKSGNLDKPERIVPVNSIID
jgi:hypothetical protein